VPRPLERTIAILCYLSALRVPLIALVLPEWAFTLPSGLLVAGGAWLYGRRHSDFLLHHAREGFRWAVQANLLLAAVAITAKLFYYGWVYTEVSSLNALWHFTATVFRWAGVLVSILTLFVMYKAARGSTVDALTAGR